MFDKKEKNAQMLTDLFRGMHHAVNSTGEMLAEQYITILRQYCDVREDGTLAAKMVQVQVDGEHDMFIPLIALVQPQGIAVEEIKFGFSIQVDESTLKKAHGDDANNSDSTRSSMKVLLSPKAQNETRRRSDVIEVEMTFKHQEPPEGVMRIIEQYANLIKPFKTDKPESSDRGSADSTTLQAPPGNPRKPNIINMKTGK